MNISTGQILAATTLVDAKRLGLKAMDAATTTNADKIVQPKMETFATHLKKIQKKIDTVKEVIREESAVTRALCFAQNLSDEARTEAFSYEWLEYPPSLFEPEKNEYPMRKGCKSTYLSTLQAEVANSWEPIKELPPSAADAVYVVDAMAFIQRFNTLGSSTFGQLQERYREKLVNMKPRHCTEVHFVGDQYDFGLKSLKGDERQRRESNINLPEYVPADSMKIPDWKTLLSNPCNKTNMLSYLASRWSQEASWPAGFCLVLGVNAQATRVTQTEHTDVDELYCPNHKEADTRIFAHLATFRLQIQISSSWQYLRSLPPTEDAFHFHVLRSLCQISLYKQASLSNPVLLPPEEYGRIVYGDRLIPVMKSKPSKPSAAKLKYCKCKKKPNCLRNCPCAKAAVPCIIACACNGDREKCGRLLTDHYDDDDDEYLPLPIPEDELSALKLEFENFEKINPTISSEVVIPILRRSTNRTSPGIDGIRPSTFKKFDPSAEIIAKIISIAYLSSYLPLSWRVANVSLFNKPGKDPTKLENRRPIAIFTFLRRLFSKVIVSLVKPFVSDLIHPSQRGFQAGRGCVENIYKLRQLIELAKTHNKTCVLVSFDARNAFNGVSRAHRTQSLKSLPLPDQLKSALLNIFNNSNIKVSHNSQTTKTIEVKDGVPQGEPASPLAFNLCIDFILRHLHDAFKGKGIQISDQEECIALGFADDLVISAASVPDAIEMSHRLVYLLNQIGLELNISKCKIFAINISGAPEVLSSELPITFLGHTDALKYLGSEILLEDRPSYRNIRDIISKRCESLIKYPYLHNWQKLIFCRTFITSLLTYPAQTDFNMQISTSPQITQAIRAINLLLESIFNLKGVHHCFIYGPKNGGLGFPNAKWVLDTNSAVTAGYIAQSADPQINHLTSANSVNLNGLLQQLASNLTNSIQPKPVDASEIEDKIVNICTDDHKMKGKRITESLQGASYSAWSETRSGKIAGSKVFQISRHSSAFVRFPERFSNAELLAAIRLRGGVPNLRCLSHVAKKHGTELCRLCKTSKESIGHIMGGCPQLGGLITDRHDTILKLIFAELVLKNPNWDFVLEPRPAANVVHHKPDILAQHSQSGTVTLIDLTIRNEHSFEAMNEAKQDKITKYEPLRSFYAVKNFSVLPVWFGARGAVDPQTSSVFKNTFNISDNFIDDLSIKIFKKSLHLYFKVLHS
ncbi:Retrovirus-related Pol polyprotein from type-2 retrotransposable element R2DM [Nymphon striatum]|nr:Retrovirus-related Pol polyprotein from type-2 retrotransposable element R2DM [Nymphon striatum]